MITNKVANNQRYVKFEAWGHRGACQEGPSVDVASAPGQRVSARSLGRSLGPSSKTIMR